MSTKEIVSITGMHCASCANIIERKLSKLIGVNKINVSYANENMNIEFDETKTSLAEVVSQIKNIGYTIIAENKTKSHSKDMSDDGMMEVEKVKKEELDALKFKTLFSLPLAIISIAIMTWEIGANLNLFPVPNTILKEFFHHLLPIFATSVFCISGQQFIIAIYRFIRFKVANMDTLVGIGTSAAFIYSFVITAFEEPLKVYINTNHSYYDVTIVVIAFISLGKYLEAKAKQKTGDSIKKLLHLQAKTALVIRNSTEVEIPVTQVIVGDTIIVKPGGKIPVDGEVVAGESYINESMISGEPMPVHKNIGAKVIGGTINTTGTITLKATKVGNNTVLSHIIELVESAQSSKAPIQALADKISAIFVPTVLMIATVTLVLWLTIGTHYLGFASALTLGLSCFVGILVIACPCALGLATPTAIIVGIGKGAKEGIFIKNATALQTLHTVNVIAFDKTGTITTGTPIVTQYKNIGPMSEDEVLIIATSLEAKSEHPIAHAIKIFTAAKNAQVKQVSMFSSQTGKGIQGTIDGTRYIIGNERNMLDSNITIESSIIENIAPHETAIFIASTQELLGVFIVADTIKKSAAAAIETLKKNGIKTIMLTGDTKKTGHYIASLVGIDEVYASILPADKLQIIKDLQTKGLVVAMAGDGINDAPALAQANISLAMSTGTDIAIESAEITILHGDITKITKAIMLSALTMRGIKQNLFWAFIYNIIGIPIAAGIIYPYFGIILSPIFAGLAMALSSVSVISNSLRLKSIPL